MKFAAALVLLSISICDAQVSQNTWLFTHLNPRPNQPPSPFGSIYAACWGWTAPDGREYAVLACVTGTSFIDITDSLDVTERGFVPGPNQPWREMKTYSHYAYVVTDGSGVGMQIIDLQYLPDSVHLIKAWSPGFTKAHTITQDGRFLYLNAGDASPNGGIRVVDLADPENPVMRGAYTQRLIHDSYIRNDTIFAAAYYDNKFVIINAQDKDNPNVITEFPNIPAYLFPHNCWTTGDRRYLVTTDEGSNPPGSAKIWNIENLNNILYVTSYRPPGTGDNTIVHNVFIRDSLLVISHYEAGLRFVNIRNPAAPVEIGYYDTYPGADSAAFRGNWGCYPFFSSWKFASSDMQTGLWVVKLRRNESKSAIIKLFELQQNYPNPFNVKSKIHYWISKSSHVILSIFDVRGRFITSLVNQQQPIGSFEVEFSGIELSSGVYFYRLQVGEFSEAKKMVLVK